MNSLLQPNSWPPRYHDAQNWTRGPQNPYCAMICSFFGQCQILPSGLVYSMECCTNVCCTKSRCYFKTFVVNTAPPNRFLFPLRATVSSNRFWCMIDCACIAHYDTRSSALATDSANGADGVNIHNNHFLRSTLPTLPKFNCIVFQ